MVIRGWAPALGLALALAGGCKGDRGEGDPNCPSDQEFFEAHVFGPVLSMRCIGCHNPEGLAKDTRMVLWSADMEGAVEHNMEAARAVAQVDVDGASLLLLKPTNEHPDGHKGGMILTRDTPEFAALEQWVARAQGVYSCDDDGDGLVCDESGAGARRIRRLDHQEYQRTVADLLQGPVALPVAFAPDNVIDGYTNNAGALVVSGLLADQYREAAEAMAEVIVADLAGYVPCDPVAEGEPECAEIFVRSFGRRVFRRPLSDGEVARYVKLHAEVAGEDGFAEGIRWVSSALLQSPGFLYRTELGEATGDGTYALTPHELAAELSYLIVGTMPDAQLDAAADDATLSDPDVLAAEAQRLLEDPRAETVALRFVDEWLGLDRLPLVTRDPMLFPAFTPEIREAMAGETHRFFGDLYRGGGTLGDLLTASYSYMTPELAAYYGQSAGGGEADAEGFQRTERAKGAGAGILAHGSVLATRALPTSSSPIHRGKLVRERLLCQHMPPPPPSINASPPPVDPALSTRERYSMHSSDDTCAGCHKLIDPIGFGFEHFDAVGRWRDMDGVHAIDDSGEILHSASSDGTFTGLPGLAAALAKSEEVEGCYVDQWARFALGSATPGELGCVEDGLKEAFTTEGGRLDALILALVQQPYFRLRTGQIAELPDDSGTGGDDTTGGSDSATSGDSGDSDTSGGSTGTTGGDDPDAPPGIVFDRHVDSMWPAGECDTVTITNESDAPIVWYVLLDLQGSLVNHWNSIATPEGDRTRFVGETYNASVEPKQSTSFGFCLEY
ncbi:MAG: DUF1592 domain-containing protein [Nannocystaceae bacterium]